MNIKKYKNEIALVFITLGIVSLMLLFNNINREIRLKELKIFLQKSEVEDNNLDHIGLVMKYRLNKRLYEEQMSQENADLIETKVNSLLSDTTQKKKIPLREYEVLSIPAVYTINFLRLILGKGPIADLEETQSKVYLEIAYYYERNKFYKKALDLYNKILREETMDRRTRAGVILHRGFCESILGNYNKAKNDYTDIISNYSDEKVSITATILLKYLDGFRSEAVRVIKYERDSVGKGEKLFKLIAFKESLDVLEKIEKDAPPDEISRIRFVKAKCFEELAEKEKAINTYQKIIKEDTKSDYAKMANRRMFMIGSTANNGAGLKQMAIMNNEVLEDPVMKSMVEQASRLEKTDEPEAEVSKETKDELGETFRAYEEKNPVLDEKKLATLEGLTAAKDKEKGKKKEKKKEKKDLIRKKIYTTDGNIFIGSVQEETKTSITLRTMIGKVNIERKNILKEEKD